MNARRVGPADITTVAALARELYPAFNLSLAEKYIEKIVGLPVAAMFICDQAVAIVASQTEFWHPAPVADVLPLFGRPTKANPLGVYTPLKACIAWARENGCHAIRFGSSIGAEAKHRDPTDAFAIFAKRLGAKPFSVTYIKEF